MSIDKPEMLAFQRGVVNSDGMMYNYIPDNDKYEQKVKVIRHGIRGTQNTQNGENKVYQVQVTESAKTEPNAEGIKISFTVTFLPIQNLLCGTSEKDFYDHCMSFVEKFNDSEELKMLSKRYARNILNGRWFYRNSELEMSRKIKVTFLDTDIEPIIAEKETSFGFKDEFTQDEKILGNEIFKCFKGVSKTRFLVEGLINFGFRGAVEVFPSQNYVSNKPKGFARPLYKVGTINTKKLNEILNEKDQSAFCADMVQMGYAALRDQKIGNALRTVDTWYNKKKDVSNEPISIEPNGASLKDNKYYRQSKNDAFSLIQKIDEMTPGDKENLNEEAMFILGVMIRGAVLSGKSGKSGK